MALTINSYLEPGAYSTLVPNPTVATAGGIPVVAVIGQGLQGPYTPQLFLNVIDSVTTYGPITKSNPLSLGISLAFQNGAPRVLGLNVEPDNSTSCFLTIPINTLPATGYLPAPTTALDAVTNLPVNPNSGVIAGSFYIQDFNPVIPDPVENSSPTTIQQAFLNGSQSLLQYYGQLNGTRVVPLQTTQQQQIVIYSTETSTAPVTAISQNSWNQLINAIALLNAFQGAFQSPVSASLLIPDSSQVGLNPIQGYRDLYSSVGQTLNANSNNSVVINSLTDAYQYALNGGPRDAGVGGGVLYVYSLEPGTQHRIIFGLFDTYNAVNTLGVAFKLPVYNTVGNPYGVLAGGTDGVVTTNSFQNAIKLLGGQRADIVVVLNTDPGLQAVLQAHVTLQSSTPYRNERIALVSGPISELYTTTIQNVSNIQNNGDAERMMYIYPTSAYIFDSVLRTTVSVDGTYLACACAGIMASHDAAEPLTHKILSGFRDIAVKLDNPTANLIAKYGVCIIENNPTYGIRVRDQLTCNPSTPETQEISIVRQLDYTAQTLRAIMDANVVATKIVASTLGVVTTLATSKLQSLVNTSIIYGFKGVVARINPNDPRAIDLLVSVRPSYPCKWVPIQISVTSALDGF